MFTHPEALMLQATEYQRQRMADAEHYRLLTAARRARKARKAHARLLRQSSRAPAPVAWQRADLAQQC